MRKIRNNDEDVNYLETSSVVLDGTTIGIHWDGPKDNDKDEK